MSAEAAIAAECDAIKALLIAKNRAYGDSALAPLRVFARADAVEQIKVRIDDKLSRLSRGHELPDESLDDTTRDLIGYLVLLRVARGRAVGESAPPASRRVERDSRVRITANGWAHGLTGTVIWDDGSSRPLLVLITSAKEVVWCREDEVEVLP